MKTLEVTCPIHGNTENVSLFWEFSISQEESYSLYRCDQCDCLFYSPFSEVDYKQHTNDINDVKDYVHLNANIGGLIESLLKYIPEGKYDSMLEIGCGFGFSLDFAKQILGLRVIGYEPSLYGELGSKELGIDIRRSYLNLEDIKDEEFDILFLSEVIEHIKDPFPFLKLVKKSLSEKGVFILTTPDHTKLKKDLNKPSDLSLLSPGAHTILYSEKSLRKILSIAGFDFISVYSSANSLVAISSMTKLKQKPEKNINTIIRQYYNNVLERVSVNSLTYTGILYRLLRNYIDFGDYEEADALIKAHKLPGIPSIEQIRSVDSPESCHNLGASCNSLLSYYMGMLNLNYYKQYKEAEIFFEASILICEKKLEFIPSASVLEYDIIWLAKYHFLLSLFNNKEYERVMDITKEMAVFGKNKEKNFIPEPDEKIIELIKDIQKQTIQLLSERK